MIVDVVLTRNAGDKGTGKDPSTGWSLLGLAVATSIDAFGAGVGMRIAGANLWIACPTIGLVCAALTYLGARIGSAAEKYLGRKAEIAGGLVLMSLGVRMLWV
jgi:putative Mn2+ efflux pump MntP